METYCTDSLIAPWTRSCHVFEGRVGKKWYFLHTWKNFQVTCDAIAFKDRINIYEIVNKVTRSWVNLSHDSCPRNEQLHATKLNNDWISIEIENFPNNCALEIQFSKWLCYVCHTNVIFTLEGKKQVLVSGVSFCSRIKLVLKSHKKFSLPWNSVKLQNYCAKKKRDEKRRFSGCAYDPLAASSLFCFRFYSSICSSFNFLWEHPQMMSEFMVGRKVRLHLILLNRLI